MKLFVIIFAAILASAAVIWGVHNQVEDAKKQKADDAAAAKEAVKRMQTISVSIEFGPDVSDGLMSTLDYHALMLETAFKNQGATHRFDVEAFVFDGRKLVNMLKARRRNVVWAAEMSDKLDRLEALIGPR